MLKIGVFVGGLALATLLAACDHTPKQEAHAAPPALPPGTVDLPAASQKQIGLAVEAVQMRAVTSSIAATGKLATIPDNEAHVTVTVTGRMKQIYKRLGDHVEKGSPLAVLDSPDLGQAESDFLQAEAQRRLKHEALVRQEGLFEKQFAAKKDLVQAQSDYTAAGIEYERATNKLLLLGLARADIDRLARVRRMESTMTVYAPIRGVVTSKTLTLGETIQAGASIFTIDDTSRLWALADIHEQDLADVVKGAPATIRAVAYPDRVFAGRIESVSESLTTDTHMAKARISVANPDGVLKPEMYMNITLTSANIHKRPAVPAAAVVLDGKDRVLYVKDGENRFKRRVVEVGEEANGYVAVSKGLQPGEAVVTKGALMVSAEAKGD